jgi:hypothetical protein
MAGVFVERLRTPVITMADATIPGNCAGADLAFLLKEDLGVGSRGVLHGFQRVTI